MVDEKVGSTGRRRGRGRGASLANVGVRKEEVVGGGS